MTDRHRDRHRLDRLFPAAVLLVTMAILAVPPTAQALGGKCQTAADCHGALPNYCLPCDNGRGGGCAHFSCVDNQCQIMTCDQSPIVGLSPRPVKTGAFCETATDCHGALPRFCVQCQNGKSGGCAHFSCVNHACEIRTCDL